MKLLSRVLLVLAAVLLVLAATEANPIKAKAIRIIEEIAAASDCSACMGVLTSLKRLAKSGDAEFDAVFTEVCILSRLEDPDVCTGVLAEEGPVIAYALRQVTIESHTAHLLCANLLGLCPYPPVRPHTIAFPKPKPTDSHRPKPSGKKPIEIAHISDTHVDLSYETGASYKCTKPICCRPYTPADAPGNTSYPAGPYGNHLCDAPLRLEESMFSAIEKLDPAFTIFTGDVVAHDIWLVDEPEVKRDLNVTFTHMQTLGKVFPAVGNHDTAPSNAFPASQLPNFHSVNPQWTYDALAADWAGLGIGADAVSSTDKYGSYSGLYQHPGCSGKLRVISFNSIFYYVLNFWAYQEPMPYDPSGQLAWLVNELQAAEDAGERVWLISHVPSGASDFFRDFSSYFGQILLRYDGTVSATFYGHTHVDQFDIAYSDYSAQTAANAKMVSYITPSMTPTSGSPSFRLYNVDPETYAVLDFTEYVANITSPGYQKSPVWEKYYSAKATYGSLLSPPVTDPHAELTPAFWHDVTDAFERNDAAFQSYYDRKSRGYSDTPCKGKCKTAEICGLRAADSTFNCVTPVPGLHFTKRDALGAEEVYQEYVRRDECGESRLRGLLAGLVGRPTVQTQLHVVRSSM